MYETKQKLGCSKFLWLSCYYPLSLSHSFTQFDQGKETIRVARIQPLGHYRFLMFYQVRRFWILPAMTEDGLYWILILLFLIFHVCDSKFG